MWPMTTPRGCASGSVGALCTRAALAASGGMRIGSWIMAPIATSHSRTTVAALMLWIAAAAVGRAGARPPIFRRRGPPRLRSRGSRRRRGTERGGARYSWRQVSGQGGRRPGRGGTGRTGRRHGGGARGAPARGRPGRAVRACRDRRPTDLAPPRVAGRRIPDMTLSGALPAPAPGSTRRCAPGSGGRHALGSKGIPAGLALARWPLNWPSLIPSRALPKSAWLSLSRSPAG